MGPGDDVRLSVATEGGLVAVSVDGNLDYYTAPLLRLKIAAAVDTPAEIIEVRLGAIDVIDSSGLSALVCAYKLARARRKQLVLRGEADAVARLLRRTSLDRVIPLRAPRRSRSATGPDTAAASA